MEGITKNSPTPLLKVEIIQNNVATFSYDALPDTGSTKAIIEKDLAIKHGLKWNPLAYDHILTDAQGQMMDVQGMAFIKVHAKDVD